MSGIKNSVILGSKEKFDLRSVPFSIKGSYLCILEDAKDRNLYLSITRSPTPDIQRKNLIKIAPVLDNKELPFEYEVTPGKLTIKTFRGSVEICFASDKQMRIRGNGVGLRFYVNNPVQFENLSPKENGDIEAAFMIMGKLLFVPLKGSIFNNAKWIPQKAKVDEYIIELFPSVETKTFETAIHEYYSNGWRDSEYLPFDKCVAAAENDFEEFFKRYPKVPEKYAGMARLAAWTIWNHYVNPHIRFVNPAVLMTRTSTLRMSLGQLTFHAMAACGDVKKAWQMLLSTFDYQNDNGYIPENIGEMGVNYKAVAPAFQGIAINYILDKCCCDELSKEDYQEMYNKLSRYADWWFVNRDRNGSGIPQYYNTYDSGWRDATIFKEGLPLQSGDLLANLVLLTEACGKLAEKIGLQDVAEKWAIKSKELLDILVKEFWNGSQFISRLAATGEIVEEGSVVSLIPIILGKRLPKDIIDVIESRLADDSQFMTPGGIVSEILDSSEFTIRGAFMRGAIVATVQLLLSMGLKDAGKEDLAKQIATRYLDLACEKGLSMNLSPYDSDLSTGMPMKVQDLYKVEEWDKEPDRFKAEKKEEETVEEWTSCAAASFLAIAGNILKE